MSDLRFHSQKEFSPTSQSSLILSELADFPLYIDEIIKITGFPAASIRRVMGELRNENLVKKFNDKWFLNDA